MPITKQGTPEWERRLEFYSEGVMEAVGDWGKGGDEVDCRCFVVCARLIYEIRKRITAAGLDVSWGHLFNSNSGVMGPECDIIIFEGEPDLEWDGDRDGNNIIRVVGVNPSTVRLIIEHKKKTSFRTERRRTSWRDEPTYSNKMRNFSTFGVPQDKIWFVAEHVSYKPRALVSSISTFPTSSVGLGKFFYFFDDVEDEINEVDINRFFDEIAKLK